MVAKLIAHGATRAAAFDRLDAALKHARLVGPKSNVAFLTALIEAPDVRAARHDTGFIDAHLAELGAAPRPPEPRATLAAAARWLEERENPPPIRATPGRPATPSS